MSAMATFIVVLCCADFYCENVVSTAIDSIADSKRETKAFLRLFIHGFIHIYSFGKGASFVSVSSEFHIILSFSLFLIVGR